MYSLFYHDFFKSWPDEVAKFQDKEINLELPGVGKDNISVEATEGFLVVTYKKDGKEKDLKFKTGRVENVTAQYKDGILYITWDQAKGSSKSIKIS